MSKEFCTTNINQFILQFKSFSNEKFLIKNLTIPLYTKLDRNLIVLILSYSHIKQLVTDFKVGGIIWKQESPQDLVGFSYNFHNEGVAVARKKHVKFGEGKR